MQPETINAIFRGLSIGLALLTLTVVIHLLRKLWRALTGITVEKVARAAGAVTAATEKKTADTAAAVARAFKEGRGK